MPRQQDRSSLRRFVVAATVALMVFGACASGSSTASAQGTAGGAPKTGGTLTVGVSADITSFDPSFRTIQNYGVARSLYDSVIRFDASLKPLPGLATSWKIADDNASIALRLRRGVKFHSGKVLTADDVVKNLEKGKDPARC
jgi:peptide/nickel transport system substrate-binding protein